ncbi:MAG: hypothetical protein ACI9KM_001691 [Rubritalea sp.]|jgi:hypothetical protein
MIEFGNYFLKLISSLEKTGINEQATKMIGSGFPLGRRLKVGG